MQSIVLATNNQGKIKEILAILSGISLDIKTLKDFSNVPDLIEDGTTLEENALKKARTVFAFTKIPALADDSGLEVFALDKRPGVYSARYAGLKATYEENNRKLLGELKDVPLDQRAAQFRCVAALVGGDFEELSDGICRGILTAELRGTEGFGYDPIFVPEGYNKTFAELPAQIKNRFSHRAIAFEKMKNILCNKLKIPI